MLAIPRITVTAGQAGSGTCASAVTDMAIIVLTRFLMRFLMRPVF